MSLDDDLKTLSEANGPHALVRAFARMQGTIQTSRRAASKTLGLLASTFMEAMRIWDAQKADGVSKDERVAGLEKTLREAWPRGREQPWRYLCDRCDDTGWAFHTCTPETPCGRPFKLPASTNKTGLKDYTGQGHCTPGHSYVTACWCEKGRAFRPSVEGTRPASPDDFAQAAKSKPTKVGR